MAKKANSSKLITLILIIMAMYTIYLLPYLSRYYYAPLQKAMGLVGRDADYGKLVNVYGIANIILYLPGGWIADKFDSNKPYDSHCYGIHYCSKCIGCSGSWNISMKVQKVRRKIRILNQIFKQLANSALRLKNVRSCHNCCSKKHHKHQCVSKDNSF